MPIQERALFSADKPFRAALLFASLLLLLGLLGCKKDQGAEPLPKAAPEAKTAVEKKQAPAQAKEPVIDEAPAVAEPVVEAPEAPPLELGEPTLEEEVEPSGALEHAANVTRELGGLMSKMLQEMRPHEEDVGKMAEVQARYRPAIDEALKRGQAHVDKLTEGEKILLQQHGIAMLQELSEDFVGLPAEVVVPVADELLGLVGVETEHQFD